MPLNERADVLRRHLTNAKNPNADEDQSEDLDASVRVPKHRHKLLKWNGWGYKDSKMCLDEKSGIVRMSGNRYPLSGKDLPSVKGYTENHYGATVDGRFRTSQELKDYEIDEPVINEAFAEDLRNSPIDHSFDDLDRLYRSHGHTLRELFLCREGKLPRIPDVVVWPRCHNDVVDIVALATKHNVAIIPFGGGTCVSGAVECPHNEKRMIISLDTSQMNKILWVNKENSTALVEAGIMGQDLDKELAKHGLCVGHEPDSYEFSTLGGWIATRASGMKKNRYGNIEDIVVHVKLVTPKGVLQRNCQVPRLSSGPDIQHFILGSEGTLGVVTEVVLKVRPVPSCVKYGSLVFPSFEPGLACVKELVKQKLLPASVRLMDNYHFLFGRALKPASESLLETLTDHIKKLYVTRLKGYDPSEICSMSLLFEGNEEEVSTLEKKVFRTAAEFGCRFYRIEDYFDAFHIKTTKPEFQGKFKKNDLDVYTGISTGEENGKHAYTMTFLVAYIRDFALDYGFFCESIETSVPWDRVAGLCRNVKDRVQRETQQYQFTFPSKMSYRVTQTYDVGACIYFYFSVPIDGNPDPVRAFEFIEAAAKDEIIASGGSISHHHGVGKVRRKWLKQSISPVGVGILRAVKEYVDPQNIFACGNLLED